MKPQIQKQTFATIMTIFAIVLVWTAIVFVSSFDDSRQAEVAGEMISRKELHVAQNPALPD